MAGDQSPLGPDAIKLNHNSRVPAQTTQKLNARRDTTDEPFRQTGERKEEQALAEWL